MNRESFFQEGFECNRGYINIRDLSHLSEIKEFVEQLWQEYRPYADIHFRNDAKAHFQERFWEMYLGVTLISHGFTLDAGGTTGPEFYVTNARKKIWWEAIAPGRGEGEDAVPELVYGASVTTKVPAEQIILRLRHAIEEKYGKYQRYLEQDVLNGDDSYVIAVNSTHVHPIVSEIELPYIIKAILPFGNLTVVWDMSENRLIDTFHEYCNSIRKKRGSDVSTDIFFDPRYSGISAVLHSNVDAVNKPVEFGADFVLIHNPCARNPIEPGTFRFGIEYWVEGDKLKRRSWE